MAKRAIIIGAGPAGLTAGLEFLRRSDIVPVILEASHEIGGISRTICYKGNRMDIGGHRFFSKSDRVMQWWMDLMPPELSEPETSASTASPAAPNKRRSRSATKAKGGWWCPRMCRRSRRCAAWVHCWAMRTTRKANPRKTPRKTVRQRKRRPPWSQLFPIQPTRTW